MENSSYLVQILELFQKGLDIHLKNFKKKEGLKPWEYYEKIIC